MKLSNELVQFLKDNHFDPSENSVLYTYQFRNTEKGTPLAVAMKLESWEILNEMVTLIRDAVLRSVLSYTPLASNFRPYTYGSAELNDLLLKALAFKKMELANSILLITKIAPNMRYLESGEFFGYTALHFAVRFGELDIVKEMIEKGANCDQFEDCAHFDYPTALYVAVQYNSTSDILNTLLMQKPDLIYRNKKNQTVLGYAASLGNWDAFKILHLYNKTDCTTRWLQTLHSSCFTDDYSLASVLALYEKKYDIFEELLTFPAPIESIGIRETGHKYKGFNQLGILIYEDKLKLVELLINKGFGVNTIDQDNVISPLKIAIQNHNLPAVELLLKHGAYDYLLELNQVLLKCIVDNSLSTFKEKNKCSDCYFSDVVRVELKISILYDLIKNKLFYENFVLKDKTVDIQAVSGLDKIYKYVGLNMLQLNNSYFMFSSKEVILKNNNSLPDEVIDDVFKVDLNHSFGSPY